MNRATLASLAALLVIGCAEPSDKPARIRKIAEQMCLAACNGETLETCPDVVLVIGADKLAAMSAEIRKGYTIEVRSGDAPYPLGDGRGTHHVLIRAEASGVGLRFKYDQQRDQFHILGYWTLRP